MACDQPDCKRTADGCKRCDMPIMTSILRRVQAKILPVPWDIISPHEAQARRNHGQDLATLRRRGGLGSCEVVAILEDRPWHKMDEVEAIDRLGEIIRDVTARLPGRPDDVSRH